MCRTIIVYVNLKFAKFLMYVLLLYNCENITAASTSDVQSGSNDTNEITLTVIVLMAVVILLTVGLIVTIVIIVILVRKAKAK